MIRKQFIVSGKVQGVWFRASTREQAFTLVLSGYVANLADGSVLVEAQGEVNVVAALERWLQLGPAQANVSRVEGLELDPLASETGFDIR